MLGEYDSRKYFKYYCEFTLLSGIKSQEKYVVKEAAFAKIECRLLWRKKVIKYIQGNPTSNDILMKSTYSTVYFKIVRIQSSPAQIF